MEINELELSNILIQLNKCELELKKLKENIEDMRKELNKKSTKDAS